MSSTTKNKRAAMLPEDRRARQAAWLFLASLAIFFFSSILLYVFYVVTRLNVEPEYRTTFYLPRSFITSTVMLVGISGTLHLAGRSAMEDRNSSLILYVLIAIGLALVFFFVQSEGMYWMIQQTKGTSQARNSVYAYTILLAVVHALHVVGGFVALGVVLVRAILKKYDHERNYGVRFCALYWHFLDIVWIVLLLGFALTSYLVNKGQ